MSRQSLLAADYFLEFLEFPGSIFNPLLFTDWVLNVAPEFYTNRGIKKSSVGEHYESELRDFLKVAKELLNPIRNRLEQRIASGELKGDLVLDSDNVIFKLSPLAVTWGVPDLDLINFYDVEIINFGKYNPLPEIRDAVNGLFPGGNNYESYYRGRYDKLEELGVVLCTGYLPRGNMPLVYRLSTSPDTYLEEVLASILYPWVTQPFSQLKMLVSALSPEIRQNIIDAYFKGKPNISLGRALDFMGNSFSYEILADYRTYLEIKIFCRRLRIQRQAWTPWFGFDFPSDIVGIDPKEFEVFEALAKRSERLFRAILETGLKWEAQYACLAGFRGRFIVSGTPNEYSLLATEANSKGTALTRRVCSDIIEDISKHLPKEAFLLKT